MPELFANACAEYGKNVGTVLFLVLFCAFVWLIHHLKFSEKVVQQTLAEEVPEVHYTTLRQSFLSMLKYEIEAKPGKSMRVDLGAKIQQLLPNNNGGIDIYVRRITGSFHKEPEADGIMELKCAGPWVLASTEPRHYNLWLDVPKNRDED